MNAEAVKKILSVQETARHDERYSELLDEYALRDKQFLAALSTMTQAQRNAVMDYIGLAFAMHLRLLEIACEG